MVLTNNLTMSGAGTGSLNMGASSGTPSCTISGPGSLTISRTGGNNVLYGSNTYTGGTVWTGGSASPTISIGNPACFGTGTLVISGAANHITRLVQTSPGILNNGGSNATTLSNALSMRADLTISVGTLTGGSITWSGPVSLFNGTRTITQNEAAGGKLVAFSGSIQNSIPTLTLPAGVTAEPAAGSGAGGITKAGTGPLQLTGANTYTGAHDDQRRHTVAVWKRVVRQFATGRCRHECHLQRFGCHRRSKLQCNDRFVRCCFRSGGSSAAAPS